MTCRRTYATARGPRNPATDPVAVLCEVFAEVLNRPSAGPDDSFFALGGDSIR
ncbi:acyl carrier protein, partial [Streptomyces roseolus]|uniref:acyl carrier protein n=1 Tax=Streptomyces roseolus TaxID=67358 RepID=UPI00365E1AE9